MALLASARVSPRVEPQPRPPCNPSEDLDDDSDLANYMHDDDFPVRFEYRFEQDRPQLGYACGL